MANSAAVRRHQASALLIRTWHWQRRQYCSIFCTIVVPALFFVLATVLNRVLINNDFEVKPDQQKPRGAFMPRPFSPEQCVFPDRETVSSSEFDAEDVNMTAVSDQCLVDGGDKLRPGYVVPVYASAAISAEIGQHDAEQSTNGTGIMSNFSLDPFAYPPAVDPSDPFYASQTDFDGILRYEHFFGANESSEGLFTIYNATTKIYLDERADKAYSARTIQFTALDDFKQRIYDKWYVGSFLDRFYSAIAFHSLDIPSDGNGDISGNFTVYYNESQLFGDSNCRLLCPILSTISRTYSAIYSSENPGKKVINLLKRMPKVNPFDSPDFLQLFISITIALVTHFLLPWFVSFLVFERKTRMRDFMTSMGLPRWLYWVATYMSFFFIYLFSIFFSYIFGRVVSVPFFSLNSPATLIILFVLWGNALISFAIFLEPFFSDPQTAQIASWFLIIAINFLGGPYIGQRVGDENTSKGLWSAIMLLPSFAYMRSIYYAGAFNDAEIGITFSPNMVRDIQTGMCSNRGPFCWTYGFLVLDTVILLVLAAYVRFLVGCIKAGNLHPLFFVGMKRPPVVEDSDIEVSNQLSGSLKGLIGIDVDEEKQRAHDIVSNMGSTPFEGVVIHNVSKTYAGKPGVRAVRSLSMTAKRGEVLTILGHNGAGKTSLFQCLVGEIPLTSGDAYVNGLSVRTELDKVHEYMGLAAQQDILWFDMNVQEHLFFFGRIKGLSKGPLKAAVETALDNVQLQNARKRRVKALSGGMRRRLSVSIAMMGDSTFVVLDEPSTGLDLLSRERLWHAIQNMRENKAVILTTHSLEEAETLSNRVAIMSQGSLKCIGTAEELKLRLGDGHRLSVSLPEDMFDPLLQHISTVAQGACIDTVVGNNVEIVLPKDASIPGVLEQIAQHKRELRVSDWAIQQSSLEDVFLKVTRSAQTAAVQKEDGMVQP